MTDIVLDALKREAAVQHWTKLQNSALYNLHFSKYVHDDDMKRARQANHVE
jgi:hypothetical protein